MKKIVILASGRGSNAEAIYKYASEGHYQISAILSDQADAQVLEKAKKWGLPSFAVPKTKNETRSDHEGKLLSVLDNLEFDLIVLAGFERLLSPLFLKSFPRHSIVNIHPSLLPLYPGLNSYERAFSEKATTSGITIHFVDEGMDTGKVIQQISFVREASDSLEDFSRRGLALEHEYYPKIIQNILNETVTHRLEIYPTSLKLLKNPEELKAKIFWIETVGPMAQLKKMARDVLIDSVVEDIYFEHDEELDLKIKSLGFEGKSKLEVSFLPGVTDNTAFSTRDALKKHPRLKSEDVAVHTGSLLFFQNETLFSLKERAFKEWANSWLEKVTFYESNSDFKQRFIHPTFSKVKLTTEAVHTYDLNISDEALDRLSSDQLWALSLPELQFIREHYKSVGRKPTDVEMEIIAQTWSEHCKHKIFSATIEHEDLDGKRKIKSIFKTFIKGATSRIIEEKKINWARSVFTDNAGIVRWDEKLDVCIKVETHNSPSALDPYGGALTGILGVNRDILGCGLGAKPIANTNVFCLPPEDLDQDGHWPTELHSPRRLRAGVHKGVQDGGNKSGIPTVNGAFHYHESYAGKPLVYCGTIGVLPHMVGQHHSHEKNQKVGDLVVMVGGRIGKDGIHGATFSSLELKEGTPSTVVQIGDPLTQKRVTDFLLKARDLDLYSSVTDNGAGGLSSSVGEMCAQTNGAVIDLALAPVKYPGLSAAELMISESQERMTCSVPPSKWKEFKELADQFNVDVSALGEFTSDGFLTVLYDKKEVAKLSLAFLHEDLPPMELQSSWKPFYKRESWKAAVKPTKFKTIKEKALALLSQANIRSHEALVRQYDHEVKAASVTKPFTPAGGPTDAGVIAMKPHGGGEYNGIVIASGLAPEVSLKDTKLMAMYSIDEAVRNAVVTGADPEKMVLIDNFCWPDPLPGPRNPDFAQKLGELVRCNEGLYEMATIFGMPFVSGKDSMKNDAVVNFQGQKIKISVLPTLLVTAMGHIADVKKTISSRFGQDEDLWLLGDSEKLNPYTLSTLEGESKLDWPLASPKDLLKQYKNFHCAIQAGLIQGGHDVSEGGALICAIEMAINSKLGFHFNLVDENKLFGEGMGLILFSTKKSDREKVKNHFTQVELIGETRSDQQIQVGDHVITLDECAAHYKCGNL
jgi:phosphoribosylformylglycinamidine synthase II/formyltetrahydrofolate-dependent phosphoribosylglycinamide formyltransferase